MKKDYVNVALTVIIALMFLIITVISGMKINGDIDSVWSFVMIVSAILCMSLSFRGFLLVSNIQCLREITSMLKSLNYSDNEVEERQKYLRTLSDTKLQEIKFKLTEEMNGMNEKNFFK
ncbi:hypothetical protein [Staphylococcus shinii]|uniref:hypothetical protein n=1 Tax=Staphylococcus shinii TaxID=2912228 RepID=UPI003F542843